MHLPLLEPSCFYCGPRPRPNETNIVVGDRILVTFSTEGDQIRTQISHLIPKELANIVAEFAVTTTAKNRYATVSIDADKIPVGDDFLWDPDMAQCLDAYCPLPPAPGEEDASPPPPVLVTQPLLHPWQVLGTTAMVTKLSNSSHMDPMDIIHQIKIPGSYDSIWFTRDGYRVRNRVCPAKKRSRRMVIPGCFLSEATGTGKTRSVLATLQRLYSKSIASLKTEAPLGRTSFHAMAIVAPPHTIYSWRQEIQLMMPDWKVLFVTDARSLIGLAAKIASKDVHLVVFSINIFTTNRKMLKSFFATTLDKDQQSSPDHQVLWTTMWHTVVLDEVHRNVPALEEHRPKSVPEEASCCLDRQAIVLKSLVPGHQYILMSATPTLENPHHVDTYLYLMGVFDRTGHVSLYPPGPTLLDHLRSRPWKALTMPGGKSVQYLGLSSETRLKAHHLFHQHCNVNTGTRVEVETTTICFDYRESLQFLQYPLWRRRMTPILTIGADKIAFGTQCRTRIQNIMDMHPDVRPTYYAGLQQCVGDDGMYRPDLGNIIGQGEDFDQMNALQVHPGLAPVQEALVRILNWLVNIQDAKIIIYSEPTHYIWHNTEEVLRRYHDIKMVHFSGTVNQLNRKRERLENSSTESKTVMFIPENHTDGTNFGFVTHVLIVGLITNQVNYNQFLGRATRWGRKTPLTLVKIQPC